MSEDFNKSGLEPEEKVIIKTVSKAQMTAEIENMAKTHPNYRLKFVNNFTRRHGVNSSSEYFVLTFELKENYFVGFQKRLKKIELQLDDILSRI